MRSIILILLSLLMVGCSTKKNNLFTRQYHELTTRYNVYFNGNEALKAGIKKMEVNHEEDYTRLLPVFVSADERTRNIAASDMDYAIEKAVKAIDKHSITVKPKRRKNKDSKNYETFRKKKEFNNQIAKCYLLLGKAYFYKKKYAMANNTFRYLQRQYAQDEKLMTEARLWLFRSHTEMGHSEEALRCKEELAGTRLDRRQKEIYAAACTDFYIRQNDFAAAISAGEGLVKSCKSMKRKPRYYFLLSQLYLKENQDAAALYALKKAVRFNFNYEMVFNAKINMALAYQEGNEGVRKKLNRMLKDSKNKEFRDRIYYALGNIEEKQGNQEEAIDLYWKSVRSSIDNDNQKSLSFLKLGDYYFKRREYVPAQTCYDSCMYYMDSRIDDYEGLRGTVGDLTDLVTHLNTIRHQDSLQRLADLSPAERNKVIDGMIQKVKDEEERLKEEERMAQLERNFYQRNDMLSRGNAFSQSSSGEWYFYNPMMIALGKNDFKRKWGRRKLEDNWRRQNKSMVDFGEEEKEELAEEVPDDKKVKDTKSRDYYLQDLPLTAEQRLISEKKVEDAYYKAGELYLYKFQDAPRALECFAAFIQRFPESTNLPLVYYLAYDAARKAGKETTAANYKEELLRRFPESDFAKGLQDPDYFKKVDNDLQTINRLYAEAYDKYRQVYYKDALAICNTILEKYPDNKLSSHVLFLRAMCMVNLVPVDEAREALNRVTATKPGKEIQEVVNSVLSSLDIGDKPVLYADAEMNHARYLKSVRNWKFDAEGNPESGEVNEENPFRVDKEKEHWVMILLPEDFKVLQTVKLQSRLGFINAGEKVNGHDYETTKGNLWYKASVLQVGVFKNYEEAALYLNRIGTDKILLNNFTGKSYRMFAISQDNLSMLKRLKKVDRYIDFFTKNYFDDPYRGELIVGKLGTSAHIFNYTEDEKHDFALVLPFRKVNVRKIAEWIHAVEKAFVLEKESYDEEREIIVVKNVGDKKQALEYMTLLLSNGELFEKLEGVEYRAFVITPSNMDILLENAYLTEYLKFFKENYLQRENGEVGIEEGDFVYNKSVPHKFVLFYPNRIDPFRLKAGFEEFNFAGLTVGNSKYDDENDCLTVEGFSTKEEAMRYFKTIVGDRKVFRPVRNTDYRNFVISESNFEILKEKKLIDSYLLFFKKYYLDN